MGIDHGRHAEHYGNIWRNDGRCRVHRQRRGRRRKFQRLAVGEPIGVGVAVAECIAESEPERERESLVVGESVGVIERIAVAVPVVIDVSVVIVVAFGVPECVRVPVILGESVCGAAGRGDMGRAGAERR